MLFIIVGFGCDGGTILPLNPFYTKKMVRVPLSLFVQCD